MLRHPRVPGRQETISNGMPGVAVYRVSPWSLLRMELRWRLASLWQRPHRLLCPVSRVLRSGTRSDSITTTSLTRHPSPRRAYQPLMLRSSLPKACGLGKMLRDCICSKWIVSGGEQSTGEFSKQSCDRSPQEEQPVPSSLGTRRGPGSAPAPLGSGLVPLGSPLPALAPFPWRCLGRSCSVGAGQKTTAPFSPK